MGKSKQVKQTKNSPVGFLGLEITPKVQKIQCLLKLKSDKIKTVNLKTPTRVRTKMRLTIQTA